MHPWASCETCLEFHALVGANLVQLQRGSGQAVLRGDDNAVRKTRVSDAGHHLETGQDGTISPSTATTETHDNNERPVKRNNMSLRQRNLAPSFLKLNSHQTANTHAPKTPRGEHPW